MRFCLLYKHTNENFLDDFFLRFPKITKSCPKTDQSFLNICRKFPKISKDFWRRTDDVSITQEHIWVLFKGFCNHSNGDLFTYANSMLFSCVKAHLVIHWCLYNKMVFFHVCIKVILYTGHVCQTDSHCVTIKLVTIKDKSSAFRCILCMFVLLCVGFETNFDWMSDNDLRTKLNYQWID